MRIGFVTFAAFPHYQRMVKPGVDSKIVYCARQNYDLLNEVEDVFNSNRPAAWSKILILLKYLDHGYDWLFWSDADTIIMNPKVRLESLLRDAGVEDSHHILLTRDPRGSINTGNFFVRNTEWSRTFLREVYASGASIAPNPWFEQAAVIQAYARDFTGAHIRVQIEHRTWKFNAYPTEKNLLTSQKIPEIGLYHRGDFLVHFAGIFGFDLEVCMQYFHQKANKYGTRDGKFLADWEQYYGKRRAVTYIPEEVLKRENWKPFYR